MAKYEISLKFEMAALSFKNFHNKMAEFRHVEF